MNLPPSLAEQRAREKTRADLIASFEYWAGFMVAMLVSLFWVLIGQALDWRYFLTAALIGFGAALFYMVRWWRA
jgi:hypothetical protein